MILVDTNILLRYAHPADPTFGAVDASIAGLHAAGEVLCVVPQNIYEFWATATRPVAANGLGLSIAECQVEVARIRRLFHFLPDLPPLFTEWETLVAAHACHGRVSYDARIIAAMRTHGITRLLTRNGSDFARFPGVTILDPVAFTTPAAPPTGPP